MCWELVGIRSVTCLTYRYHTWPISDYKYIVLGKYRILQTLKGYKNGVASLGPITHRGDREGLTVSSLMIPVTKSFSKPSLASLFTQRKSNILTRDSKPAMVCFHPKILRFHTTILSLLTSLVLMACLLSLWVHQAHGCHKASALSLPRTFLDIHRDRYHTCFSLCLHVMSESFFWFFFVALGNT